MVAPRKTVNLTAYYDAAATTGENDYASFSSIITEDFYFNTATRTIALGRERREIRNNPYLAGIVNAFPVAIGISNLRARTSARDYNLKKDRWWRKLKKRLGIRGESLRTIENIVKRELLIAGEIFIVKLASGRIQLVASEFCGSPFNVGTVDGSEINGILYHTDGTVKAYRFGQMSPSGLMTYETLPPVDAKFVIHVYDQDRVQLGRGLPWLLPCIKTARDLYEITRSKTKQIKDANQLSGTIEKLSAAEFLKGWGAPETDDKGAPKAETPDAPADKVSDQPIVIELKPGTFIALEPGEKLNSLMSQYHASDYKELVMLMLHAIATPIGLPVELWFSGLGDVAYSGFKGLGTQWDGRRRSYLEFLEDMFLDPLHDWAVGRATDLHELPPAPADVDSTEDKAWAWRRTAILDEEKDAKANQYRLSSGEKSLGDVWEEQGLFPEEVFEHRRQLWIKLQTAAGKFKDGTDAAKVEVPEIFLLRGLLPGEQPINPSSRGAIPVTDTLKNPATEPAPDLGAANQAAADDAARAAKTK